MLKTKPEFECKEVLGDYMVIPKGDAMAEFSGTLILSETAASAWKYMEQGCGMEELADAMEEEYDASREEIMENMEQLVGKLKGFGVLEEEE